MKNRQYYFKLNISIMPGVITHSGFIIDGEGNVLKYKNPQNWNFADKDSNLTESQVQREHQ